MNKDLAQQPQKDYLWYHSISKKDIDYIGAHLKCKVFGIRSVFLSVCWYLKFFGRTEKSILNSWYQIRNKKLVTWFFEATNLICISFVGAVFCCLNNTIMSYTLTTAPKIKGFSFTNRAVNCKLGLGYTDWMLLNC